jgi:hypothetical protein
MGEYMKEELESVEYAYIWHSQQESDTRRLKWNTKEKFNSIER